MGLKAAILILAIVLALITWLGSFASYFVWPLGLSSDVTLYFGEKRDVAFCVPDSMYRAWISELGEGWEQPCTEMCTRTFGITFSVFGQEIPGDVCPWHGMTLLAGSKTLRYGTPPGLGCLVLHTPCREFVQPKVGAAKTLELFGSGREMEAQKVYAHLEEQLVGYGAPVKVREEGPGLYWVYFAHHAPWDPDGVLVYYVDVEAGIAKNRTRLRCPG